MDIVPRKSHHSPRSWTTYLYFIVRLCAVRVWYTSVVVCIPRLLAVAVVSLKNCAALLLLYMSDKKQYCCIGTYLVYDK